VVGLDGEQVVGAGITDRFGDRAIGGDGIDRDQCAAQPVLLGEAGQQKGDGGQFIGFVGYGLLIKDQSGGGGEGGDQVDRCLACSAIVAAP